MSTQKKQTPITDALRVEGEEYLLSLQKLTGKSIKDVHGHITNEFGDVTFQMSRIVFDDGTNLHCEGEHDMPYLTDLSDADVEKMQASWDEENEGAE